MKRKMAMRWQTNDCRGTTRVFWIDVVLGPAQIGPGLESTVRFLKQTGVEKVCG